jgi:hypothetical protein
MVPKYKPFGLQYLPFSAPGLIFDGAYGLVSNSSVYLLFPAGLLLMWKKNRNLFYAVCLLLVGGLIPISGFHEWWGGWCPSTRYLVPVVPLFSLAGAYFLFEIWKSKRGRFVFFGIVVLSLFLSIVAWNNPQLLWNRYWVDGNEFNHAYGINEFWVGNFGVLGERIQSLFPNFFLPYPFPQIGLVPFLIKISAANFLLWAWLRPKDSSS